MRCRTHIWAAKGKPDEAFITVTFPSGQSSDDGDLLGGVRQAGWFIGVGLKWRVLTRRVTEKSAGS